MRLRTAAPAALHPASAITAFAAEAGMDLIALATHDRGPMGRSLLGSVADKVLRTAPVRVPLCPVRGAPSDGDVDRGASPEATSAPRAGRPDAPVSAPAGSGAERPIHLRRVAVAAGFAELSRLATRWMSWPLAGGEVVLTHTMPVPEPPRILGASLPSHVAV